GRERAELLPGFDRALVFSHLREHHREAVPRVGEARIEGERLLVLRDRLRELAVAEEVDGLVVEVVLARHPGSVAHSRGGRQARPDAGFPRLAAAAVATIAPHADLGLRADVRFLLRRRRRLRADRAAAVHRLPVLTAGGSGTPA